MERGVLGAMRVGFGVDVGYNVKFSVCCLKFTNYIWAIYREIFIKNCSISFRFLVL